MEMNVIGVLTFLLLAQQSISVSHSSKLCRQNDTSCQPQLERLKLSEADCMVKYFPSNSKVCEEWTFEGSSEQQLGSVKLDAYVYTGGGYVAPAFNVSMQHIKWNHLRMRFKMNSGNFVKNVCREFHLPAEIPLSELLFFDCPWAGPNDAGYKNDQYIFEYDASSDSGEREHRMFSLLVPNYWQEEKATAMVDWQLFVYVDMTEFPYLTLHWTAAPNWLGGVEYDARSFVYLVTLHYRKSSCKGEDVEERSVKLVKPGEELQLLHKMSTKPGEYCFGVQLRHPDCGAGGCNRAFSPPIIVEGHTSYFVNAIVTCTLLMGVMLTVTAALVRRYSNFAKELRQDPPTVLIVYIPTHRAHIKVVFELAAYLRVYCGVNVMLHDTDVPGNNAQELHHWFCDAYEQADFVMVVASPLHYTDLRDTIYVSAGDIALKFLRLKFAETVMPAENFFCVLLPYCDKGDLPADVKPFKKFFLMKDLDKMLWHLQGGKGSSSRKVPPWWWIRVAGGSVTYSAGCGRKLAGAIADAVNDLRTLIDPDSNSKMVYSPPQSITFQPYEDADTLLDPLPQTVDLAETHSPYYPDNMQDLEGANNCQPTRVHTTRHVIDSNMML